MTMLNRGQHCTQGGLCTGELIFKRWYDRESLPGPGHRWIRVYGWVNEMDCIWNEWDPNGDGQIDRDDFLDSSITSYGKIKPAPHPTRSTKIGSTSGVVRKLPRFRGLMTTNTTASASIRR